MAGDDDLPSLDDWGPVDDDFWGSGSFLVPPPPPPPSLGSVCSGAPFYCEMEGGPMGAHFDRAAFPSLPIIAVCSSVVLVAVLVASFLLWRHKSKVQNLLPCKNEQQGHLGELGAANGVTYEDVLINHHPTRLPQAHIPGTQALMPLEILDVKLGEIGPPQITTLHHHSFYPGGGRDSGHHQVKSPFHHPLYEEVDRSGGGKSCYESDFDESGGNGGKLGTTTSDDDFAEDEFSAVSAEYPSREGSATSSVRGSTGGDLCRDPASSEGEDCDYAMGDLVAPDAVAPFGYHHGKHLRAHPNTVSERPDSRTRGGSPRNHLTSYPIAERTVVPPPAQRITEGGGGNKTHSTPLKDCNRKQQQQPAFLSSPKMAMPPPPPANAQQWPIANHEEQHYPSGGNSSQENIYSTIDEEDYHPSVLHPPSLTSLACCPQRGGNPSSKHSNNSAVPKSAPVRDRPIIPTLSQRNAADDNGSSYGDIMPAFNSASFT